ncbi:MAG: hypothetical protein ABFD98_01230 [Syntrophobacteraceae bacterium]|nr:hypothetical protein [Desulfobacteraceae bacterium]
MDKANSSIRHCRLYILLAIFSLFSAFPLTACGESVADLSGEWNYNALASGPSAPWWFRGSLTVDSDGNFTGEGMENDDSVPSSFTGVFSSTPDGYSLIASTDNSSDTLCQLDAHKSVMVCTETWKDADPGSTNLIVLTKKASFYSTANMAGTWNFNTLASGPGAPWWERGTMTFSSGGVFSLSGTDSKGSSHTTTGEFSISPDGIITCTSGCGDGVAISGAMDAEKRIIAATATWGGTTAPGTAQMMVLTRKAKSYAAANLAGVWEQNGLGSAPAEFWWNRGHFDISANGTCTATVSRNNGYTETLSLTLSLSPSGKLTCLTGCEALQLSGVMDAARTVMVWTGTWPDGTAMLEVFTKLAAPSIQSFQINKGTTSTENQTVTLNNAATGNPTHYMASESASFKGASWQTYSTDPAFTLSPGNGTKKIYFKVKNDAGQSAVVSDTIKLGQKPSVVTFQIANGAAVASTGSVRLNNTVTGSPTHYMASESPEFAGASWIKYSSAPKFTLSAGIGTKTVYFKLKNSFGESGVATDSIDLMLKPAVTSFKINNGDAGTESLTVTLNNTATNSPTHYMASESASFKGASWLPYATGPAFTLSSLDGTKKIYFKVKNDGGESAAVSDSIVYSPPATGSWAVTGKESGAANIPGYGTKSFYLPVSDTLTLDEDHTFHADQEPMIAYGTWSQSGSTVTLDCRQAIRDFVADYCASYGLEGSVTLTAYSFSGTVKSGKLVLRNAIKGTIRVAPITATFSMTGSYSGTRLSEVSAASFVKGAQKKPALKFSLENILRRAIQAR